MARLLVDLFCARFDPEHADEEEAEQLIEQIDEAIDAVESLDHDQILRMFLGVVRSMLRTNYFRASRTASKRCLSFKLDPARLPWLPHPAPAVRDLRVFAARGRRASAGRQGGAWRPPLVRSPRGLPHRGAGLMKAQMVKNAVIVPVGAKGGFVVKRPPTGGDREALHDEVLGATAPSSRACST